ncbi:MAG: cadherin-like beta sandwich domain-containing protein [Bacilli bacterium]|nr:cadherin-like beta sandwich domain-containing protein [Bacilli bacterium]
MKKISKILFILFLFITLKNNAYASSVTIKSSNSTINKGNQVTITATISADSGIYTAAGSIYCSGAGVGNGIDLTYEDLNTANKSLTRSVKVVPTSSGTITCKTQNVRLRELAKDGEYSLKDESITITVTNNNSSGGTGTTNETKNSIKEKSSDNTLSNLSVEGYEISPKFNKDTLEYILEVNEDVEKISIKGTTNDKSAEIKGTGEITLTEGENKVEIKVTAENGNEKKYIITVTVKDLKPINVTINNKNYTVVKKKNDNIKKLEYYEEEKIKIDNQDVISYINKVTKTRLVVLKDQDNKLEYFIYNENNKEYKEYKYINVGNTFLQLVDYNKTLNNYKKYSIKIDEQDVDVYKTNEKEEFSLIYGINVATGNKAFYQYDEKEKTIARYNDKELSIYKKTNEDYRKYIILLIGVTLLVTIVTIIVSLTKSKKRKRSQ